MEIERTGGLRIHADTGQIARQQMPSRDQRHYRELNHLAGARQHTGKRVDDVADDRRRHGGSVDRDVFVSSAVAFNTCCAYHPSRPRRQPPPRQRVRLLCGVPYGAGQFGDLAWGHG